jgi:hypothetical protein
MQRPRPEPRSLPAFWSRLGWVVRWDRDCSFRRWLLPRRRCMRRTAFLPKMGIIYSATALALAASGYGRFSLDEALHWQRLREPGATRLALMTGVAAGLGALAQRKDLHQLRAPKPPPNRQPTTTRRRRKKAAAWRERTIVRSPPTGSRQPTKLPPDLDSTRLPPPFCWTRRVISKKSPSPERRAFWCA